jgi:hypothetical protein
MQEFSTAAAAVRRRGTSEAAKVMGFERSILIIYSLMIRASLMVRFKYSSYSIHNNPSMFLSLGALIMRNWMNVTS